MVVRTGKLQVEPDLLDHELVLRPIKSLRVDGITIDLFKIVNIEQAEACWKTIDENVEWFKGEFLLHVKRHVGGWGCEGGVSEFCKNVGISRAEAYELMRVALLMHDEKVSARADRFKEAGLTISHFKRAARRLPFSVDEVQKKGSLPEEAIEKFQNILEHALAEELTVSETEDYAREQTAKERYEDEHGPSQIDLKTIKTANVILINDPDITKYAHGSVPEEILRNIVWIYNPKGDLVLDPLAGTGTLAKVCKKYGWPCLSYDVDPDCYEGNDDIQYNDIRNGLPDVVWQNPPAFVFLDPPYFNKQAKALRRAGKDLPFKDFQECYRFLRHIVDLAARAVREGGYVGFIIMDYIDTDENAKANEFRYDVGLLMRGEIYRILADHPDLIIEEGWQCPLPTEHRTRKHGLVRKDQGVSACARDIWIAKKVSWKPFLICPLCHDLYSNPMPKGERATDLDYWPVVCESCTTRLEEMGRIERANIESEQT